MSQTASSKKERSFINDFLIGATSAAVSKTIVAPIERARLLYIPILARTPYYSEQKYMSIFKGLKRIASEEGITVFWRRNLSNVVRYFPTQALNFACKDFYKKTLCQFNP